MVRPSLILQTTTSSPSLKWGLSSSEGGEGCGGGGGDCWDNNTVWWGRSIERWHEVTWRLSAAEQTLLCGRKRLAGTFQPCRVFTGDRPPVLSAPAPAAPGRRMPFIPGQTALIPPSAAHAASSTTRLPVYLGWWTFQFTFLCRLGGSYNNTRPGRRGSTNNIRVLEVD